MYIVRRVTDRYRLLTHLYNLSGSRHTISEVRIHSSCADWYLFIVVNASRQYFRTLILGDRNGGLLFGIDW